MTENNSSSRRDLLKSVLGAGAVASGLASCASTKDGKRDSRPGSRYMGDFAAPALDRIRLGFIGTGLRGSGHVRQMLMMEGVDVLAVCDSNPKAAARSAKNCVDAGRAAPAVYDQGEQDYLRMLEEVELDAVIIATPWLWHGPMGVATMEAGAHAFLEVPIATTLDEIWQLVDTSEATGRHCMMMENCCYGRSELLFLNMVRKGVIGELTHGEGAYIHDLRSQMAEVDIGEGNWRVAHHAMRDGNLYPTHGVGPIAQMFGLERGTDRFERIVSFSSPAFGRSLAAGRVLPADHERNHTKYICGDMNSSLIKTQLGRTLLVQHDTTSPRPYTRLNTISGTLGTLTDYPLRIALDPEGKGAHRWLQSGEELAPVFEEHEHPLYTRMGEEAVKAGGHGGMDFIMLWRMAYCLRNGLPMDQNVYEGASWSAICPLSETSNAKGGDPELFPDFTRGRWKETKPLGVVS